MMEQDCIWSRISSAHTEQNTTASTAGYNRGSTTLRMGAQREIMDDWFMGATAGYTWSRLSDADGYSHTDGRMFDASVSLKHESGPWLFVLAGQVGYGRYDTLRILDFGNEQWEISGTSNVLTNAARLRTSRQFDFTDWYIKPNADIDVIYKHMPA